MLRLVGRAVCWTIGEGEEDAARGILGSMALIEITRGLDLSLADAGRADMHSLLNATNLFYGELIAAGQRHGNPHLHAGAELCLEFLAQLGETPNLAVEEVLLDLRELRAHLQILRGQGPKGRADAEVILAIQDILEERLREHATDRLAWLPVSAAEVRDTLWRFLEATATASRGRFRILPGEVAPSGNGYAVACRIHAERERFRAPLVFQDVVRDLVANCRKYSEPPSRIEVDLRVSPDGVLDLAVKDYGIGIPEAEIEHVVELEYRASNVSARRTHGGGIGLAKAYLMTRVFGGRFWIDSEIGKGTTIRLTMHPPTPDPEASADARDAAGPGG